MKRIVEANALPNYRLFIRFEDGAKGEVDLSSMVGNGVFASWKDQAVFSRVAIDISTGTVIWPGGIDLCPDTLYSDVTSTPIPGSSLAQSA